MKRKVSGVQPVPPETGQHHAALDRIGRRIVAGEYPAGSPLDLGVIGTELGVSRSVVREALRVLDTLGMARAWPKRGTFITNRSEWSWLHPLVLAWYGETHDDIAFLDAVAQMREIIEPKVAGIAAQRRTEQELAGLQSALERMAAAVSDTDAFIDADVQFHRVLLNATHNELLMQVGSVVEAAIRNHDVAVSVKNASAALGLHRDVAAAVAHGASAPAEAAMLKVLAQAQYDAEEPARGERRTKPSIRARA